jgi:steroid delta-isomerase-like uncharacterized protein
VQSQAGRLKKQIVTAGFRNCLRVVIPAISMSLLLLAACRPDGGTMNSVELNGFATRYAAAWSSQNPSELASFYAENGYLRINDGEPHVGREAVEQAAREFMTAFPDMTIRLVEVRQVDQQVEFHWHWTGTHTGPGGSGNAVDLRGYEQWTLDESGLILESLGHMDDAEYQRQLSRGIEDKGSEP